MYLRKKIPSRCHLCLPRCVYHTRSQRNNIYQQIKKLKRYDWHLSPHLHLRCSPCCNSPYCVPVQYEQRQQTRPGTHQGKSKPTKDIDTDKLAEAFSKPRRSPREILNLRLLRGSIFTLCGLGFVIFGLVGLANDFTIRMEPVMIPMICGASCLAVGISYLIVYFVTRKQLADEDKK